MVLPLVLAAPLSTAAQPAATKSAPQSPVGSSKTPNEAASGAEASSPDGRSPAPGAAATAAPGSVEPSGNPEPAAASPPESPAPHAGTPVAPSDPASPLLARATEILISGSEDLGLQLAQATAVGPGATDEPALLEAGGSGWALSLEVTDTGGEIDLRLVAVAPGQRILRVAHQSGDRESLELSVLRLLRDVVRSVRPERQPKPTAAPARTEAPRDDDGRAYLATTGALVGGYVGYSLEHIAGSSDARLIYPLMTLGAGVGVGASLMAADEWEVRTGEAWYLSATTLWSTAAALFITDGVGLADSSHRHAYGLLGTATGLSLGTLAISVTEITQGGAILTQSGALFGGLFGALTERMIEANVDERPTLGLGVGLGSGTLLAGLAATLAPNPSPTRVVYIDLSAVLGGLTGAAAASPVLVGNKVTQTETRVWIGSVAAGTLLGAVAGYVLTEPSDDPPAPIVVQPTAYSIPGATPTSPSVTALGFTGRW